MNEPLSHRERSNRYQGELCRCGLYRVIVCKDGIQWIIQRQKGGPEGRWRSVSYCVTRKTLLSLWAAYTGSFAPELVNLPEQIGFRNER